MRAEPRRQRHIRQKRSRRAIKSNPLLRASRADAARRQHQPEIRRHILLQHQRVQQRRVACAERQHKHSPSDRRFCRQACKHQIRATDHKDLHTVQKHRKHRRRRAKKLRQQIRHTCKRRREDRKQRLPQIVFHIRQRQIRHVVKKRIRVRRVDNIIAFIRSAVKSRRLEKCPRRKPNESQRHQRVEHALRPVQISEQPQLASQPPERPPEVRHADIEKRKSAQPAAHRQHPRQIRASAQHFRQRHQQRLPRKHHRAESVAMPRRTCRRKQRPKLQIPWQRARHAPEIRTLRTDRTQHQKSQRQRAFLHIIFCAARFG